MSTFKSLGLVALVFGVTTLSAIAQTTPSTPATQPLPAGAAAVVNGKVISEVAVWRGLQSEPPERRAKVRPEVLNLLIENAILDQYVLQMQIKVDKAEIDKKLAEGREEMKKGGRDFDKMMKDMKLGDEELRENVAANLRWDKFTDSQITDKLLQDLFNTEKDFFNGSQVRARHILLAPAPNDPKATEAAISQLRALKKEIEASANEAVAALPPNTDNLERERRRQVALDKEFAKRAEEKSVCPTKEIGGDLNYFTRDRMTEPFARAAFALQPFQMSDVVQTPFGVHLVLVTDRKPGIEVKFDEAKDQVRQLYCERLRDAIVAKYRPKAQISIAPAPVAQPGPAK
jgi:peptidyl-prolyl cis-trans isomerase C